MINNYEYAYQELINSMVKKIDIVKQTFCDHYCKYPDTCSSEDELLKICECCILDKLEVKQ